nr:putative porin [uncultured Prevotella sp.]
MKKLTFLFALFVLVANAAMAQTDETSTFDDGTFTADGYRNNRKAGRSDSIQSQHKEIPRGLKVWTIDERFGDRKPAVPDTLSYMYMNADLTYGKRGEYNTLGNLGSPRQNRIFIDRRATSEFFFLDPYDMFIVQPQDFQFTSTLSPITILSYNSAGDRNNGEDRFKAIFAVNAGKEWGFGFKFDYLYGRGYYSNQSASHFNYSMWGSYLGERYQAHLLLSLNHQKVAENGGIANDAYITHPESFRENFSEDEIPTVLKQNWNRNDNQHVFFNHRYSLGFFRKVPMTEEEIKAKQFALKSHKAQEAQQDKDKARRRAKAKGEKFDEEAYDKEKRSAGRPDDAVVAGDVSQAKSSAEKTNVSDRMTVNLEDSTQMADLKKQDALAKDSTQKWMKDEYVPVTSFIHTARFDNYRRTYQAYNTPTDFYAQNYFNYGTAVNDTIYDRTKHWSLKNTFAVALLEGFNKWAKAGLKAFLSYELRHYTLPSMITPSGSTVAFFNGDQTWNQHDVSVGGQLLKTLGKTFHYDVSAEAWLAGSRAGQFHVDGHAELGFPLLGDTVQLAATAFFHRSAPSFYMEQYYGKHYWWDNSLDQQIHSRILGEFSLKKTRTKLRVGYDVLKNYTYFGIQNDRVKSGDNYLVQHNDLNVRQSSSPINLLTLQLQQDFRLGILNWQNVLTLQKSSKEDILPVPTFNAYSNLFIRFKIARVLDVDLGVDGRYFTSYYAPEYIPGIGTFGIQETDASRTKIGNYPHLNAYANFQLQHTRFYVMFTHVNSADGGKYFYTPHYPLNQRVLQFGISWNFFN